MGAAERRGLRAVAELAVLVGLQASGKTSFCRRCLSDHVLVSKDRFPRSARHKQARQMRLVEEALTAGRSVVVDNTNPSPQEWRPLVAAARSQGARAVAYWFPPDLAGSLRRNEVRTGRARVPDVGIHTTLRRLCRPGAAHGFDAVYDVRFDGRGGFVVGAADGSRA
ncbi:ATP-binding protein [Streptomyces sp. NPDC049915]|uniref:ATP-binding protein n=1 Tax=Streptomyces sp. NPDC049915 TaxID=3155510 RepID=UPI00344399FD